MLNPTEAWKRTYPGALQGWLLMRDVANPEQHPALERRKAELEAELRARFAGYDRAAFGALPTIHPYAAYYGRFKKSYHVQLQLESIVLKGKSLPRVAALVEAMFIAELESQLLTAGHDFESLRSPLRLDVATGEERYTLLNGKEETLKPGDMFIADAEGVTSCIVYGPDQRTRITPATRHVALTVYAPPGIEEAALQQHLGKIESYVRVIAPQARTEQRAIFSAG